MPRYFFNVVQAGQVYRDGVGQEFSTETAALEEARLVAGELVREAALTNRSLDHVLEVRDPEGNMIITFRCSDTRIVTGSLEGAAAADPDSD